MLNIVIISAGDIGAHIAAILSKDGHNVILIDKDKEKLEKVSRKLNIETHHNSGTDWQLFDDLQEKSPHVLLALTNDDEVNLTACTTAKHLGYPRTIARVTSERYLNRSRLDFAQLFDVDYFINPELQVAHDIMRELESPGMIAVEHFAHGAVQLRTFSVPASWQHGETPLRSLNIPPKMMVGLISRQQESKRSAENGRRRTIIFPHGDDVIRPLDEVTFIGEKLSVNGAYRLLDLQPRIGHSAIIAGGSLTGQHLAGLLIERDVEVHLIEKKYRRCQELAELLPEATIIHHDCTDFEFMRAEKFGDADVIITATGSDETNFITALLGKEAGCNQAIITLSNMSYAPLAARHAITHTISPRLEAANHILSQILSGTVTSLVSLYENQAEVMEVNVSQDSKLVGIPLSELGPLLPNDFLIAMIQNRGRIMVATGDRIISPGDTLIVITSPKHVHELEKIF